MLNAIMRQTTGCAIKFEPQFDTFEDLFKSCRDGDKCENLLDRDSCDYLNESLVDVTEALLVSQRGAP